MKRIKLILTIFFLNITFLTLSAQNTDNEDITIEEIIIKDKSGNNLSDNITNINDLNIFLPLTAGDVLQYLPGLNLIKRSAFSVEPGLHLFKREQINLMFDGGAKVTQSCANRMDAMTTRISAGEIEKIELIKGPYSVRFGKSFGGIINIITKHSEKSETFKIGGSADVSYNLNGNGLSNGLLIKGGNKKFDFFINGTYRNFGNYESGNKTEIISSFKAYDYSAKAGYNINDKNRIQISFRESFAKDVMHAGLPMDALKDDGKLLAADYLYKNNSNILKTIKLKIYGSLVDHLMTNEFKKTYKFTSSLAPVNSKTAGGKSEFTLLLNNNMTLFTGFDGYFINRDGVRNKEMKINPCTGTDFNPHKFATDKIWQNSYTSDYGIFAELNYKLTEKAELKTGIRNDFIKSDISDPENDFEEFYADNLHPSPQNLTDFFGKLAYRFKNNFNLTFAAGKSSRTPDLLELFINHSSVGQDAYEYLGNPNLKPERNYQTDLILSQSGKIYSLYVDLFYSYITNYITARVDSGIPRKFTPCMQPAFTKQFINADEVFQYGFDAGFKIKIIKDLILTNDANYTFAQNKTWNEPVAEIAPFTLKSNLSYKYKKFLFALNNRYAASQNRIARSFNETSSPGFNLIGFYINYNPFKFASISFAVDNITNINYYEHTSRSYKSLPEQMMFYEPGRSFKLALTIKF